MRYTFTDLKTQFLNGSQNPGSTDTTLLSYFQLALDSSYQLVLAQFANYLSQQTKTASTVVNQQFYHYPPGIVNIEDVTVTIGTIAYPLTTVNSQLKWDRLNETLITTSAIPLFIFPRRDDFGIWPIPQGIYTITFNYLIRDRRMTNDDYTTGSVTATNNSQSVTGSGVTWTAAMIGRWFSVTNDGYWYRIKDVPNSSTLTLETSYEGTTGSALAFRIGESPELPEEAHPLLYQGALSRYFSEVRGDIQKGTWFNNVFWTGDGNNNDRTGTNVHGGLIGLQERYAARSNTRIIKRTPYTGDLNSKLWATKIT